ncbi:hypothetical protein TNCV_1960591 [Trichonephila clavipes]|nr:hypothetical protein TNCV_1960591 [Trichonephila clavipes]
MDLMPTPVLRHRPTRLDLASFIVLTFPVLFREGFSLNILTLFPFFVFAAWKVFPLSTTCGLAVSWTDSGKERIVASVSQSDRPRQLSHDGGTFMSIMTSRPTVTADRKPNKRQ